MAAPGKLLSKPSWRSVRICSTHSGCSRPIGHRPVRCNTQQPQGHCCGLHPACAPPDRSSAPGAALQLSCRNRHSPTCIWFALSHSVCEARTLRMKSSGSRWSNASWARCQSPPRRSAAETEHSPPLREFGFRLLRIWFPTSVAIPDLSFNPARKRGRDGRTQKCTAAQREPLNAILHAQAPEG